MPKKIEAMEIEQKQLHEQMVDPEFYKKDKIKIVQVQTQLSNLENELKKIYQRWELLEELDASFVK